MPLTALKMRGVGADAERQRQDDDGRPALGVQQHADGVTKILEHRSSERLIGLHTI